MFKKKNEELEVLSRRTADKLGDIETKIGKESAIKGEIEGKNSVRLDGMFEGKAKVTSLFVIGASGNFKGELSTDGLIVDGQFDGIVTQAKKVELRSSAKFRGTIVSNVVAIAEGSFFEGEIKMEDGDKNKQFLFEEKRKIKTKNDVD